MKGVQRVAGCATSAEFRCEQQEQARNLEFKRFGHLTQLI
jgi:hypothetical protein